MRIKLCHQSREVSMLTSVCTRNADSVVKNDEDGVEYFVKPHTTQGSFTEFLDYLQNDTIESSDPVKYAQSRKY